MVDVTLEFSGGLDLLFDNQKELKVKVPPTEDGKLPALLAKLDGLSARVAELEQRASQPSNGMDFLQRHEGLSLRRPTSHPSMSSLQQAALPRNASYTNLSHVEVPMPATRVVMTQVVSPADTTGSGICSGGTVLSWIDVAAGLAAKTLARAPVVTASLDAVHFLRPCKLQSIVTIAAMVNRVFASSMEVGVQVEEEDVATGARHHCCSAYLTFVALSRRVNAPREGPPPPKKLPPKVVPTDDYYRDIFEEAAARARRAPARPPAPEERPGRGRGRGRLPPAAHRAPALGRRHAGAAAGHRERPRRGRRGRRRQRAAPARRRRRHPGAARPRPRAGRDRAPRGAARRARART
ncbi:hypothetical protein QBZ16_002276 [Prototheca wickerhamii]|uniref:HotDog ACOT-type domain-containing protein n=1 Tax=Prototheca wickerhamii TaxID=3111 RepID=A0AAD9IK25_PROWI|nr:hypothetical protein QBZ16_002276 [Prototheca wickerhamii]